MRPSGDDWDMTGAQLQRPSQTDEGVRWLENFDIDERATARLLIDSLRIVGADTFMSRMRQTLASQLEDLDGQNQPALFSLAEHTNPNCDGSCDYFTSRAHWSAEGSAHLTDFIVDKAATPALSNVLVNPTLKQMELGVTRQVFIVTDSLLSGTQLVEFAAALYRSTTFKSWHSFQFLRSHVVAYAVTDWARDYVRKQSHVDQIISIERGLDLWCAPWSDADRVAVMKLCTKYSSRGSSGAFGFNDSGSLIAFAHTLPDNLPLILTQQDGRGGSPWVPFAGERNSGLDLAFLEQLPDHQPEARLADFINAHANRKSTATERALIASPLTSNSQADLVNILVAVRRQELRSDETLATALALPIVRVRRLVTAAQSMNLMDEQMRPTRPAARLLRNMQRRADRGSEEDTDDDDAYYPQQLR